MLAQQQGVPRARSMHAWRENNGCKNPCGGACRGWRRHHV